jgi:MFS family permease
MWNKNFLIIVVGQVTSLFGSAIQRFCLSLYILELTGSSTVFATILAASMLPYVILAPFAGGLADRVGRKAILVVLDFCCAGVTLLYGLALLLGFGGVTTTATVMIALSALASLYAPALVASIPQIVATDDLVSANAVVQQVGSLSNVLGPVIAGILYGAFGIRVIILANAVTFLAAAVLELCLDMGQPARAEGGLSFKGVLGDMQRMASYLKGSCPVVLSIIMMYGLYNILVAPILSVYAPFYIRIDLGLSTEIYGIIEGVAMGGMILSGILLSLLPRHFRMDNMRGVLLPISAALLGIAISQWISIGSFGRGAVFALCCAAMLFSLGASNVVTLSYTQRVIPQDMLGRVSALSTAVSTVTIAAGQLIFGLVLDVPVASWWLILGVAAGTLFITFHLTSIFKRSCS